MAVPSCNSAKIFGVTAMLRLWNLEESWSLYRNTWPGPNWVVIGLLADWTCIVDDAGNLFPVQYVPARSLV